MNERITTGTVEVVSGVMDLFSKTGLSVDVGNVWVAISMQAQMGKFEELKPARHYSEYFAEQEAKFKERGKGLLEATMKLSNPKSVEAFDKLVDEFNEDLPRIIREKDNETVQEFFHRAGQLIREKLPEN